MNVTKSIFYREKGFSLTSGYDIALLRLKCYKEDVFRGVAANEFAADYNPYPPTNACEFCSAPGYEHLLALANEDGKVALQDTAIKSKSQGPLPGTQAHNNSIHDIAWMPKELKLVTASGDCSATLWNVSNSSIELVQRFQGNVRSIKCVAFRPQDKSVFATGARDGTIMIWDTRASYNGQPKPDNVIMNAHKLKQQNMLHSTTALIFQDDENLISCSAGDGLIKVWDLRKNYTLHKKELLAKHTMKYGGTSNTYNGFTSMMINPAGITLYASCIDRKIYAYNLLTYSTYPVSEFYGHGANDKNFTFFLKACLSPDGEYILSGSNDETAYVWSTRTPGVPVVKFSGHRSEVTCVAWCSSRETKIVTCSDDSMHRVWRIRPHIDHEEEEICIFGYTEKYDDPSKSTPSKLSACSTTNNLSCSPVREKYISVLNPTSESIGSSLALPNCNSRVSPAKLLSNSSGRIVESSPSQSYYSSTNRESTDDRLTFLLTSGLPNFVIDGTAPHLLSNSPQKKIKEKVNWLVDLGKRKRAEISNESEITNAKKKRMSTSKVKNQRELKFKNEKKTTLKSPKLLGHQWLLQ